MEKYQKLKNSGLKWIGDIPNEWKIKRLKFTTSFDNSTVDRHVFDDEIKVSIAHYPQVYKNEKIHSKTKMEKGSCTKNEFDKFQLKKDDILITKDSETPDDIGVPAYIQDDIENTVSGYHISHLKTIKNEILGIFLFRYLQSDIANSYFETETDGVTRFGLGKDSISNLKIIFPSIKEQEQITKFLDKKTMKIDSDIQKNHRLIELLKEKRESTINEAVTKGLEPSTPMKNSGFEYIGKIPQHWRIHSLKHFIRIPVCDGPHETPKFVNDGIPFLSVDSIQENKLVLKNLRNISVEDHIKYSKKCKPEKNDLLLGKAASIGKVAIIDTELEFNIWSPLAVIRLKEQFCPKFYYYFMISNAFQIQVLLYSNFNTQGNIGMSKISNLIFIEPIEKNEQEQIAKFLDEQTSKIDSLISKIETQIEKLKELRKSLISSAVTGKIDVRGAVA